MFTKCLSHNRIIAHLCKDIRNLSYLPHFYSEENKTRSVEYMKQISAKRRPSFLGKFKIKKQAAVLVSLCVVNNEESMLFTQRSFDMPTHKGQVSFPGGGVNKNETIIEACLRETEEEIGVPQNKIDIWEILPSIPDQNMTSLVYPVVGNLGEIEIDKLNVCKREVEKVFVLPLSFFFKPTNVGYTRFRRRGSKGTYLTPVYQSNPRVWGLTALAADITLGIIAPQKYTSFSIKL